MDNIKYLLYHLNKIERIDINEVNIRQNQKFNIVCNKIIAYIESSYNHLYLEAVNIELLKITYYNGKPFLLELLNNKDKYEIELAKYITIQRYNAISPLKINITLKEGFEIL